MAAPRRAIDEDKLDFSQLFLELRSSTHHHKVPIVVRIGRQDLNYGDGSLVSIRDLNVRRPFDGIKLALQPEKWSIDVFAAKPVATSPGFFDDAPDHTQTFWGIWATNAKGQSFVRQLDFYYLGLDRKNANFDKGTAREFRNTRDSMFTRRAVNGPSSKREICRQERLDRAHCLRGSLCKQCPTQFREFRITLFSKFKEQFPAATQTRTTPAFRRFIRYFPQAFTTVIWSSRVDRSTQPSSIQVLECSFRRVFRSMSIASFCGDREQPMASIRKLGCSCARDKRRQRAISVQPRIYALHGMWKRTLP